MVLQETYQTYQLSQMSLRETSFDHLWKFAAHVDELILCKFSGWKRSHALLTRDRGLTLRLGGGGALVTQYFIGGTCPPAHPAPQSAVNDGYDKLWFQQKCQKYLLPHARTIKKRLEWNILLSNQFRTRVFIDLFSPVVMTSLV